MDMLEKVKTKHIVAPGINWLIATLEDAEAFGYPKAKAEQVGYKKELNAAIKGLREMHKRGIIVLPGGDYGFAWTPHGTYARDLSHFRRVHHEHLTGFDRLDDRPPAGDASGQRGDLSCARTVRARWPIFDCQQVWHRQRRAKWRAPANADAQCFS